MLYATSRPRRQTAALAPSARLLSLCSLCASAALALAAAVPGVATAAERPPASAPMTGADSNTTLDLARAARSAGDLNAAISLYRRLAGPRAEPALLVELGDT